MSASDMPSATPNVKPIVFHHQSGIASHLNILSGAGLYRGISQLHPTSHFGPMLNPLMFSLGKSTRLIG